MSRLLLLLILAGALGATAGYGTYAAFSGTTSRASNSFAGGTVTLSASDAVTPLYSVTSRSPGDSASRCVRIAYEGSLPATVRLYRGGFTGGTGLEAHVDLTIERGSGEEAGCADFTPAETIFADTLASFAPDYASGLVLATGGGGTTWSENDAVTYRVTATLRDETAAQGLDTGTHPFTWEARSQ